MKQTFAIGIGGAAGQGVATPGDIFAKIFSRRGLHLNAYNAYQSIIRGGHTFLTIRTGPEKVTNMGDHVDLLIPLNQDAMDRHLGLLTAGAACLYNADTIKPGVAAEGAQLCPLPVSKLADISRNKVAQNTLAIGAGLSMMGVGFQALEEVLAEQFKKKGEAVVSENVGIARAGYELRHRKFQAIRLATSHDRKPLCRAQRQRRHGHGRRGGGSEILLRLSDEPFDRRSALDGGPRPQGRHHGPPGGRRDWRHQHGHRRGACRRSRPCAPPPAAALP